MYMFLRTSKLQVSLCRLLTDEITSYHLARCVFRMKTDLTFKSRGYSESFNEVLNPSNELQCLAGTVFTNTHQHSKSILPLDL